jgi:hypothetical protein
VFLFGGMGFWKEKAKMQNLRRYGDVAAKWGTEENCSIAFLD